MIVSATLLGESNAYSIILAGVQISVHYFFRLVCGYCAFALMSVPRRVAIIADKAEFQNAKKIDSLDRSPPR